MEATSLLACLRTAGLTVSRNGDQLLVAPRERLTDELRHAIREAKPKLLSALTTHPDAWVQPQAVERRIRVMAKRWSYSAEELAVALAGGKSDPDAWFAWTELDEQHFGGCATQEDFARAYSRIRGLV